MSHCATLCEFPLPPSRAPRLTKGKQMPPLTQHSHMFLSDANPFYNLFAVFLFPVFPYGLFASLPAVAFPHGERFPETSKQIARSRSHMPESSAHIQSHKQVCPRGLSERRGCRQNIASSAIFNTSDCGAAQWGIISPFTHRCSQARFRFIILRGF